MAAKFRILSLDGGGLRGIIPVMVLKGIERRSGKRITDLFDMVAGTSTGGLIACGITVSDNGISPKYALEEIEKIYVENGKDIFPKKSAFNTFVSKITSLKNPKYSAKGLQKVLTDLMGDKRISDCAKPILITTYDLFNNEALIFKYRQAISHPDSNALLKDICRATSAAPTYLPAYDFVYRDKKRLCVDGGLYMNNPSMGALIEMVKYHREAPYNLPELKLADIAILSLGTGHYTSKIAQKKVEGWGLLDWAPNITDVMMQAINQTINYQAEELTHAENFLRINPIIDNLDYSDMADSSDEARNYFFNLANREILGNSVLMKKLDAFLDVAANKVV